MPLPVELRSILWFLLSRRLSVLLVRHARAGPIFLSLTLGHGGGCANSPRRDSESHCPFRKHYSQAARPQLPSRQPRGRALPRVPDNWF